MNSRKPKVLTAIEKLRIHLNNEVFKRKRFSTGRNASRKIDHAQNMIKELDGIEEFVREHIPEEQWKGMLG